MAKAKQQIVLGIKHEIEDEQTDVTTEFHVVRHISLDLVNGYHVVTLDSYARQRTYDRGGRSVGSAQFSLNGKPPRGSDLLDWVYQSIVATVPDGAVDAYGQPQAGNAFTGADLVYADLPDAVAE